MITRFNVLRSRRGFAEAFGLAAIMLILMVGVGAAVVAFAFQSRTAADTMMLTSAVVSRANVYAGELTETAAGGLAAGPKAPEPYSGVTTTIDSVADVDSATKRLTITARFTNGTDVKRVIDIHRNDVTHIASVDPDTGKYTWTKATNTADTTVFSVWSAATDSVRKLTAAESVGLSNARTKWLVLQPRGGIDSDGHLWMWGSNTYGQLGDNSTVNSATPKQIGTRTYSDLITLAKTTFAIDTSGNLWAWGFDGTTNLIYNADVSTNELEPVKIISSVWIDIASDGDRVFAVNSSHNVYGWGSTANGGLGGATGASATTPGKLPISGIMQVAASGNAGWALADDGDLFGWGTGIIGDGTDAVNAPPTQIKAGTKFTMVTASNESGASDGAAAIDRAGKVWSWGTNTDGRLGDGTTTTRKSPVATSSGTFISVFMVRDTTYGIAPTGALYAWGSDEYRYGGAFDSGSKVPVNIMVGQKFSYIAPASVNGSTANAVAAIDDQGDAWKLNPGGTGLWSVSPTPVGTTKAFRMPVPSGFVTSDW
ncbi:RCC1 domain-containing protein [Leifsonia sp. Leaf264]|uniref:RCC1 domain-containing protein n=1 Tax=Leifsonia sp. Leaf264 TaxID=1736314 RepID=UPI0006F60836|nr:hypothetical protein [Leifsonia sp. Leaf264]KQO98708.1 hypothetical protein ASF30_11640 [Leifsonia sp. Leaf264]